MRDRVFDKTNVTAGTMSPYSGWIHLPDNYEFHAINGYYSGTGVLVVFYQISASEAEDYIDEDVRVTINVVQHGTKMVFHEPVFILPNEFIRFYAVEEGGVEDISTLIMSFIQKGRSA